MRYLLIDGDIVAYEIASNEEKAINWEGDAWTVHADAGVGKANIDARIEYLLHKFEADSAIVALTHAENFRKEVLPTYKANRKSVRKPIIFPEIRQHLIEQWNAKVKPGLEGDDVLGIFATHPDLLDGERVIYSGDKDLNQIPGKLVNGDGEIIEITEMMADYFHFKQTLTGDQVDGYAGCPGVGPVKADALLKPAFESGANEGSAAWAAIVGAYQKAKLSENEALVQARVARICRWSDYDYLNQKALLWNPPRS